MTNYMSFNDISQINYQLSWYLKNYLKMESNMNFYYKVLAVENKSEYKKNMFSCLSVRLATLWKENKSIHNRNHSFSIFKTDFIHKLCDPCPQKQQE